LLTTLRNTIPYTWCGCLLLSAVSAGAATPSVNGISGYIKQSSFNSITCWHGNRCTSVRYDPGGGGVNVAQVAHNLGASVTAVFPAGGATGDVYGDLLTARGVPFHRVKIARSTRESFTIDEISTGLQYRFVLPGPSLTFAELQQCLVELRRLATSAKFVVASGSLPPGAPANFYQQVALVCRDLGARLILDTSGGGLRHLTSGVFLLKASVRELRECVGRELVTESEQMAAAHEIIDSRRAYAVAVSMGSAARWWRLRLRANAFRQCLYVA